MKYCPAFLVASLIAFSIVGCERSQPDEANPPAFDPALDPVGQTTGAEVDENLLADQEAISLRAAENKPTRSRSSRFEEEKEPEPIEIVKKQIADVLDEVKSGNTNALVRLFDEQTGQLIGPLITGTFELEEKVKNLLETLEFGLEIQLPEDIQPLISNKSPVGPSDPGKMFANLSVDDLTFEEDGEDVVVTMPGDDGGKFTFTLVDSDYKLNIPELSEPDENTSRMIDLLKDVIKGQLDFIDKLTVGIEDGQITEDNFEPKAREIAEQTVMPALQKFMAVMMPGMDEAMKEGFPPSESPTTEPSTSETAPASETSPTETEPVE